jgi:hypothetical protein
MRTNRVTLFALGVGLVLAARPVLSFAQATPPSPALAPRPAGAAHLRNGTPPLVPLPPNPLPPVVSTPDRAPGVGLPGVPGPGAEPGPGLPVPDSPTFDDEVLARRLDCAFTNLPFEEVVEWLRKQFATVNFVCSPRLRERQPVVLLKLRAASLPDILAAIEFATDGLVEPEVRTPRLVTFGMAAAPVPPNGDAAEVPPPAPRLPSCQVMNLHELLGLDDPVHIAEALEVAQKITMETLERMKKSDPGAAEAMKQLDFNYHSGSGVLVLMGHERSVRLALEVLRALRGRRPGGVPLPPGR